MDYKIELEHASCIIEPWNRAGLSSEASSRIRILTHLYVDAKHRNQGQATRLIEKVIMESDEAKIALMLECKSYGDLSEAQLKAFYAKHGFTDLQAEPHLMVRYARLNK